MNEKSKRKRQERVKRQKLLQREKLMKEKKETRERELLQHATRDRKQPIVNPKREDHLMENIAILEKAMAEHEALMKVREENKAALEAKQKEQQQNESVD